MNKQTTNEINTLLDKAKKALVDNKSQEVYKLAARVCELDPTNINALLMLAAVSEPAESVEYLKRVLDLDPGNKKARQGMRWAIKRLKIRQQSEVAAQQKEIVDAKTKSSNRNRKKERNWGFSLFLFIVMLGVFLMVWIGIPVLQAQASVEQNSRPKNVLVKPTLTPTMTPTPTLTPTPTPTQTPSPTPTADTSYASYFYHSWDIPEEVSGTNDFWIEVDLSAQMLYAYRGSDIISAFIVSTGTSQHPTVTGAFKIYAKHPTYTMIGPGYNLPDVPYALFFYKGYSIHGTYWHSNFGIPMSHGCVNMQTNDAAWIYNQAGIGTYVFVHY